MMTAPALPMTAKNLGELLAADVVGNPMASIERLSPITAAAEGSLCFLTDRKYLNFLKKAEGAVVLTHREYVDESLDLTYLVVEQPKKLFAEFASRFRPSAAWEGISPQAVVHPTARIGARVNIGPFAVIGDGAEVGDDSQIYPHAYVGSRVSLGKGVEIHPFAAIHRDVVVGDRCKIFSGAVIGSDGFGFFTAGGAENLEMPQIGRVILEADVRVGANATIDRGTLGDTRVGRGVKFDDHAHLAHNCVVGAGSILCAQTGVGGSVTIGERVILAGQAGIAHGLQLGDRCEVAAQAGVTKDVPEGVRVFSTPAIPMREFLKIHRYFLRLPDMWKRLARLEELPEGETR